MPGSSTSSSISSSPYDTSRSKEDPFQQKKQTAEMPPFAPKISRKNDPGRPRQWDSGPVNLIRTENFFQKFREERGNSQPMVGQTPEQAIFIKLRSRSDESCYSPQPIRFAVTRSRSSDDLSPLLLRKAAPSSPVADVESPLASYSDLSEDSSKPKIVFV